ncbi:hypothetical protein A2U01_0108111, partial [Trifolium medium]|nr:hypothetical protein [Trifolium medium]
MLPKPSAPISPPPSLIRVISLHHEDPIRPPSRSLPPSTP